MLCKVYPHLYPKFEHKFLSLFHFATHGFIDTDDHKSQNLLLLHTPKKTCVCPIQQFVPTFIVLSYIQMRIWSNIFQRYHHKHKQQFESNENAKINCVFHQGFITMMEHRIGE